MFLKINPLFTFVIGGEDSLLSKKFGFDIKVRDGPYSTVVYCHFIFSFVFIVERHSYEIGETVLVTFDSHGFYPIRACICCPSQQFYIKIQILYV